MTAAGSKTTTSSSAARRAVVLVLIVAVPVVFDTSVTPAFALPKFTVLVLGAAVLAVLAVAEHALGRATPLPRLGLEVPLVALLGWTAISAAFSAEPTMAALGDRESFNGLVTALALVVVFLATAETSGGSYVRTALWTLWFGAGGVVLLYGAVQLGDRWAGGHWDPITWRNTPGGSAVWATLGNPNDLAGFLAILLPVGLVVLALGRTPLVRAATAVMILLALVELGVSGGRGALVGLAAAVATLAWWYRHELRRRRRLFVAIAGAVAGVGLVAATMLVASGPSGPAPPNARELLAFDEGTTVDLRVELWRTAWRMGEENPVLGVGPSRFGRAFDEFRSERFARVFGPELLGTDPHNVFLLHLATTGFPGLLAFSCLVAAAIAVFRRTVRGLGWPSALTASSSPNEPQALVGAIGAALIAFLIQACFNRQDIALDVCAWVLLGLVYALASGLPASPRRARTRAAMATRAATAATARATQETAFPSPSSAAPPSAETSRMSLHHS